MTDKINKETLIMLDVLDAKNNGTQLPVDTKLWIEKHGMPDIAETIANQQKRLEPASKLRKTGKQLKIENWRSKILKVCQRYGFRSDEAVAMYRKANKGEHIGVPHISAWTGIDQRWLRNHINPTKTFKEIEALYSKGYSKCSQQAVNVYRKAYMAGTSITMLKQWTGLENYKLKKLLQPNQYMATVTWIVAKDGNDTSKEPFINQTDMEILDRVKDCMKDGGMYGEVALKIVKEFGDNSSFTIKIRPLVKK